MKTKLYLSFLFGFIFAVCVQAQSVGVKANVLSALAANIHAGVEVGLDQRWTMDISGSFNAWDMSNGRKWKHWMLQPEMRYWLCDRYIGHFFGFHLHGGQYNIGGLKNGLSFLGTDFSKLSDSRYQGWFAGAGIAYGYAWPLSKYWNLEAEIGLGYSYADYEKYPCAHCGDKEDEGNHSYLGVTKAALNLVYVF